MFDENIKMKPPSSREILNRLKSSAKRRKIECTLTLSDINNLSFPITCPVYGFPLYWNRGEAQDDSYSFDRIDSTKGYIPGNIQIISWKANRLKNNATNEDLKKLSDYQNL